LSFVTDYA